MLAFFIIVVMLTWCMCMVARSEGASFRAFGGRDALPDEFPYVVGIELWFTIIVNGTVMIENHDRMCTGSVLTPTVTLTAAHCYMPNGLLDIEESLKVEHTVVIRFGSSLRPSENDSFSNILGFKQLPPGRSIDDPMIFNDLGLLKTQPISLSKYARLSAVNHYTLHGQGITLLGFGLTNHSGVLVSTLEQKIPLQVVDAMWSICDPELARIMDIKYPHMCAVRPCRRQAVICEGDSGGPAVHASGIVGVISMGPSSNCQLKSDSARFTTIVMISPLSSSIDWISNSIKEMELEK